MNERVTRCDDCGHQDQITASGDPGSSADLCEVVRFAMSQGLAPPDPKHQGHTDDAEDRIDRCEPWDWYPETAKVQGNMMLNPNGIHVEDLVERGRLKDRDDDHEDEREDN